MPRPKGSTNANTNRDNCKTCNDKLVLGVNYLEHQKKNHDYRCKFCRNKHISKTQKQDKGYRERNRMAVTKKAYSEGIGLYQIKLNDICLYVGEGALYKRKTCHLGTKQDNQSRVADYCLKHNINRSTLSFNVLEHENDTSIRKQKEDWYITFLNPVINPEPPLGIYV